MKVRQGFVSNSSSSSFVIAMSKEIELSGLARVLFEAVTGGGDFYDSPEEYRKFATEEYCMDEEELEDDWTMQRLLENKKVCRLRVPYGEGNAEDTIMALNKVEGFEVHHEG